MDASKRVCSSQHSRCLVNAKVYHMFSISYKFLQTHSDEPLPRHASSSLRVHALLQSVACGQEKLGIISEGNGRYLQVSETCKLFLQPSSKIAILGSQIKIHSASFNFCQISASKSVLTHRIYYYRQLLHKQPVINSLYSFQIILLSNTARRPE